MKKYSKFLKITPFISIIVISICFFTFTDTGTIIDFIGIKNAYLLMFAFAFFAGISTFNAAPYYYLIYLLANAGFDPLILGPVSALGIMAGDSFVYFMGREGKDVLPKYLVNLVDSIGVYAQKYPKLFLVFCFSYGCISPFSNNFITIGSGIAEVPFKRIMIPLTMGNIVYNTTFVYLVVYASDFVSKYLA